MNRTIHYFEFPYSPNNPFHVNPQSNSFCFPASYAESGAPCTTLGGQTSLQFLVFKSAAMLLKPLSAMTSVEFVNTFKYPDALTILTSLIRPPNPGDMKLMQPSGVIDTRYFKVLHAL